jgi:transposase
MEDIIIGVDLAERIFQLHGATGSGELLFRKRLTRDQFRDFMSRHSPSSVVLEACGSSSYWAREMQALAHKVRLIAPQYVKPFVKRQKNGATDAEAIVIAAH